MAYLLDKRETFQIEYVELISGTRCARISRMNVAIESAHCDGEGCTHV